jgi:hypothetical protein
MRLVPDSVAPVRMTDRQPTYIKIDGCNAVAAYSFLVVDPLGSVGKMIGWEFRWNSSSELCGGKPINSS